MIDLPWSIPVRLSEFTPGTTMQLVADEAARAAIAKTLDLLALHRLEASVKLKPWLDGGELRGAWSATVLQTCGVTLDPFETAMEGAFTVRVVHAGSENAPSEDFEEPVDPDADDPPDVLEHDVVDVAAYVVEHFALELDPFPRKPGAEFEPPPEAAEPSPFAALARLKPGSGSLS